MPIEFYCKTCQKRLRCPDSAAGSKARCPQCSEINSVPLFSDPPPVTHSTADPRGDAPANKPAPRPPTPAPQGSGDFNLAPAEPRVAPSTPPPFRPSPEASAKTPSYAPPLPPSQQSPQPPAFFATSSAPGNEFGDAPQKDSANPYAAPMQGGIPDQPADQSSLASSLGVVSIVIGGVTLVLGFCCCPIAVVGAATSTGLGIFGWSIAARQLKQTKHAPYLRHLEPPARTALILCIIGTVISALATLLYGGSLLAALISSMLDAR